MQIYECSQGSPEWFQARSGVISASMFKVARSKTGCLDEKQQKYVDLILDGVPQAAALSVAGYKAAPTADAVARALRGERVGEPSAAARVYAFQLAVERISGEPLQDDQFETFAMRRGHELEPFARASHEALGVLVRRCGFIKTDCGRFGASTDGLIADDGAAEYKCLVSPAALSPVLLDNDLSDFTDQLQGGLMVTERAWMHYGLYCPALENVEQTFTIRVIRRDDEYIAKLRRDLEEFDTLVNSNVEKLRAGKARNEECIEEALACIA